MAGRVPLLPLKPLVPYSDTDESDVDEPLIVRNQYVIDDTNNKVGDTCTLCDFVYETREDLYFHGYDHKGLEGLKDFALRHKVHILQNWALNEYNLKLKDLKEMACRSFNYPLQPDIEPTEGQIQEQLTRILHTTGKAFKARLGISRILTNRKVDPGQKPVFMWYKSAHDMMTEHELKGNKRGGRFHS